MAACRPRRSYARRRRTMNVYCLFCETEKCGMIAKTAEDLFPCRAISPKQVQHTWSKGKPYDIVHDLLPGYVFLYFDSEKPDVTGLRRLGGVIRCLSDTDGRCELAGSDEGFALSLLHCNGVIGKTQVYREGDRIRICKGAFEGVSTEIVKVDRRRSRMMIEIPFANQAVRTWVEFEITEPE